MKPTQATKTPKVSPNHKYNLLIPIGAFVVFIAVIALGLLIYRGYDKPSDPAQLSELIYLGTTDRYSSEDNAYVFTNYNDLQDKFKTSKVSRSDFSNYNYALVSIQYDGCFIRDLKILGYKIDGNKITVSRRYNGGCGICAPEYRNYLVPIDKSLRTVEIEYDDDIVEREDCRGDIFSEKPIIYLYPEQETEISVQLGHPEHLTTTYPRYDNGWRVLAQPSGDLTDLRTGRSLYSLYWEGNNYPAQIHDTGFIVKGEDTAKFLEEKLAILGLTEREANEFIIYWLPKMEHNPYNYIYFATTEEINSYMPLSVEPQPDTTIRVMMEFKPLSQEIEMNEQILAPTKRHGFTVVEWGGSQISE